ncbi:hypothetical protein JG687_00011311 [Phytophthora cactorum]|uniref:Uncharacterized protein n=1 Tax=Phytophthora cactorum TaxID=29920 RepID=A0A8T1U6W2_9STRA|nr:hypothetical protein JG687_00011311 [Phytophthora cactorum]
MPMENDYEYFVRDCYTGIITITGTPIALIYSEGLKSWADATVCSRNRQVWLLNIFLRVVQDKTQGNHHNHFVFESIDVGASRSVSRG